MTIHKKYRFFLVMILFFSLLSVCSGEVFDFKRDRDLSVSQMTLSKMIDGKQVDFMQIHLFTLSELAKHGVVFEKTPEDSLGFMIFEVLDEKCIQEDSAGRFVYDYYYTPLWGYLKDEDKYVETYLHYEENAEDFGGRSYCPDCGEPMACGTRYLSISEESPIWLQNQWIDFEKGFKFDLQWTIDGEELSLIYQKE
jgi:hypothetical protein